MPIAGYVICAIHDDEATARAEAAGQIAFYSTVQAYDPIHQLHGFGDEVAGVREAFARRDPSGMARAVSERMLEAMAVFGPPDVVRQRFAEGFADLYERPLLYSPSFGISPSRLTENLEAITDTFASPGLRPLTSS